MGKHIVLRCNINHESNFEIIEIYSTRVNALRETQIVDDNLRQIIFEKQQWR